MHCGTACLGANTTVTLTGEEHTFAAAGGASIFAAALLDTSYGPFGRALRVNVVSS